MSSLEFEQIQMTVRDGFTVISLAATGERLAGLVEVTVPLTAADFVMTLT